MDENVRWLYENRCEKVTAALKRNRFDAYYVPDKAAARQKTVEMIPAGASVAFGGSMTLLETGIVEAMRDPRWKLIDRYAPGLERPQLMEIALRSLQVDYFLSSANAVTETGEILFVDGANTRVAPVLFGPAHVILVIGVNKICPDLAAAQKHMQTVARPVNCKRLDLNTPCVAIGSCQDCSSPERICNSTVILHRQNTRVNDTHKIHVIMVAEALGY
jgi:L-lactate utilization protein LutB